MNGNAVNLMNTTAKRMVDDDLDRLTGETLSGAATSTATFAYDLVGNRTQQVLNGATNT